MSLNGMVGGQYYTGAEMSEVETGGVTPGGMKEKEAEGIRAGFIAAGGNQGSTKGETPGVKKQVKEVKKASKTRKSNTRQIEYLQKQKLNSLISQLRRAGLTQFKNGATTF